MSNKKTENLPMVMDFEQDAGAGLNNLGQGDLAIPFINILQSLSPQVKPVKSGGLEGAQIGMIYNSVTKELSEELTIVPCGYQKVWIEWKPRNAGGGFVKQHDTDAIMASTTPDAKNDNYLPNGNMVVPTANYFALIIKEGVPSPVIISMTKTQLTKSKKWNSIMKNIILQGKNGPYNPPMYSHKYHLTTAEAEKNGFSWYGWDISNMGPLKAEEKAIYEFAKKLSKEVEEGKVKAKPQQGEPAETAGVEEVM